MTASHMTEISHVTPNVMVHVTFFFYLVFLKWSQLEFYRELSKSNRVSTVNIMGKKMLDLLFWVQHLQYEPDYT